jgi:hypothetical protein
MAKELHSVIKIDNEDYNITAKNADTVDNKHAADLIDVIEGTYVSSTSFKNTSGTAITGETGKIYVDTATNKLYRWSGTAFVEASPAQNAFSNIAVAGQSQVAANKSTDTLTLIAGNNITITTNAATDSITIASTGGSSGGDGGAAASAETIKVNTDSGAKYATITISKNEPSAGTIGDLWFKY